MMFNEHAVLLLKEFRSTLSSSQSMSVYMLAISDQLYRFIFRTISLCEIKNSAVNNKDIARQIKSEIGGPLSLSFSAHLDQQQMRERARVCRLLFSF